MVRSYPGWGRNESIAERDRELQRNKRRITALEQEPAKLRRTLGDRTTFKSGGKQRYFTPAGGYSMALMRGLSCTAAWHVGLCLQVDASHSHQFATKHRLLLKFSSVNVRMLQRMPIGLHKVNQQKS